MTESIILSNVKVISLTESGTILCGFLRIVGGKIEEMGSMDGLSTSGDEYILDLDGKTVLPGLIDSHCHLINENAFPISEPYLVRSTVAGVRAARLALESGLTSVRDVGCRHLGIYALQKAVMAGEISGPRFQTSGRPISGTGIMPTWRSHAFDGPFEMLHAVRREWQEGANWIKVSVSDGRWRSTEGWQDTPLVTQEEIQAVANEAHSKDMRVACHVDGPIGAKLAVEAGVDSIEHGVSIPDDLLEKMAERGIVFVPTIWIYSTQDLDIFQADLSFLNELHADTVQRALKAGVKIAAGVDFSYTNRPPQKGLLNELTTLLACGLNNMDVLLAATMRGAELLGWEEHLGSFAPGMLADLIVVEGDPSENIDALESVALVMQGGQIVVNRIENRVISRPVSLHYLLPSWMSKMERSTN